MYDDPVPIVTIYVDDPVPIVTIYVDDPLPIHPVAHTDSSNDYRKSCSKSQRY